MTVNTPGSFDRDDPRHAAELAALDGFGVDAETIADDRARLTPTGELDMLTAPLLQQRIDDFLAEGTSLVVDLSRVEFLDSAGLRALLLAHGSGRVELCDPSPVVLQTFEVAKVATLLLDDSARR
jgi:anti-anti-sigma factor